MFRLWMGTCLLILLGLSGCQLTREPKPPRPPEEFRRPPDEARYQTPNFYPGSVLNQDSMLLKAQEDKPSSMMGSRSMGRGAGMPGGPGGPGGP